MRKLILLAGAAAMAASMPALSQGRGQGQGKGGPSQAEQRGGGHQGDGRGNARAERGPRGNQGAARAEGRGNGKGRAEERRAERGQGRGNGQARQAERRVEREQRRVERRVERDVRRVERREVREVRGERDWNQWMERRVRGGDGNFGDRLAYWRDGRAMPVRVARGGCPPGLAKQNAFCLPPGQLRRTQLIGRQVDAGRLAAVPEAWLYRFADDDDFYYRYDPDGYVYRIDRDDNLVSTVFPLLASSLSVGQPLPLGYDVYNLPMPYRELYIDDDEHLYRYDDGAIYQVDTETRLIESVVALLSGSPLSVGSPLPTGYDAYNLPLDYRDQYVDDADSLYRYANGGIYEVDPTTMLVQALVEMVL